MASAFGVISGLFGIINAIVGDVSNGGPSGGHVFIKNGLSGNNAGTDGKIQKIFGFNTQNGRISQVSGENYHMVNGGSLSKTLNQGQYSGQDVGYLDLVAADDAVCIAWIKVKSTSGVQSAWTGDYGKACGGNWHVQSDYAGTHNGNHYVPHCTWIDKDHTNGIPWTQLKINLAFNSPANNQHAPKSGQTKAKWCAATAHPTGNLGHPVYNAPGRRDLGSVGKRSEKFAKYIIHSDMEAHVGAAQELCESETSLGPDFVGPDGWYCDMEDKVLYPLCSVDDVPGCITLGEADDMPLLHMKQTHGSLEPFRSFTNGTLYWPAK